MDRNDLRHISPIPWVLVVLLGILLAGLILVRLVTPAKTAEPPAPVETAEPTPEPTPDPAEQLLADMTLREKLCQLLVVQPQMLTGEKTVTAVDDALIEALKEYPVGGFLLAAAHMKTADQLSALTRDLSRAVPGAILAVDEEGGRVGRLMYSVGTTKLQSMYSYKDEGAKTAYKNAWILAQDLKSFGFNTDFAPVADVWTVKGNIAIGDRAYSDDYDEAAELIASAVKGFHDGGALCCLKHFPGHGSTATDSHEEAAIVQKDPDTLKKEDLKPFVSGIKAGADMVMIGHITVPEIDDAPASMSRKITTDLLRKNLGFEGVIITDGLQMAAAGSIPDGEKALRCLNAGADLLLEIADVQGTIETLERAVKDGKLKESRIDESILRVLHMKLEYGIL